MTYFGGILIALGLTMWTRGMIYTLRPQGKIAEKRKRKNLKYGFTTDMKVFGRKIRRLGFMLALFGSLAAAWASSGQVEAELTGTSKPLEADAMPAPAPAAPEAPAAEEPRVGQDGAE